MFANFCFLVRKRRDGRAVEPLEMLSLNPSCFAGHEPRVADCRAAGVFSKFADRIILWVRVTRDSPCSNQEFETPCILKFYLSNNLFNIK